MNRGFTLAWRKELESPIWSMPPLYHRIWYWLRLSVNHAARMFNGVVVGPGQRLTSLRQIAEGVAWKERGVLHVPNTKTIRDALSYYSSNSMVSLECNRHGTLITILNWELYANPTPDESITPKSCEGIASRILTKNYIKETPIEGPLREEVMEAPKSARRDSTPYAEVLNYLNAATGKNFRACDPTKKLIRARFHEGYTLEDFRTVIDNKVTAWRGDPEWEKFLRPQTLFGSKFDAYLNEVVKKRPMSRGEEQQAKFRY